MECLHELPIHAVVEREERYRALQQRTDFQETKRAFDTWCAAWFWPADRLEYAPTPATFYRPSVHTRDLIDELASELHFFHWELEFPDVFARPEHGFDAILANPPWDIARTQSQEFFTNYDPLYRTYGRQEALNEQHRLFAHDPAIEREWLLYQAHSKSMTNWVKHAASPFGDPNEENMNSFSLRTGKKGEELHNEWRIRRSKYPSYTDQEHPFRYQSSIVLNTYKMFLELTYHILKQGGRFGMLVPSGVYTDQASMALRKLFLDYCNWEWLFGFINWRRVFDIDSRYKFVILLLEKGGHTNLLRVAFNRVELSDLEQPNPILHEFPRKQVEQFSPKSLVIIEPQTMKDLSILEKLYTQITLLADQSEYSWQIQYTSEFHMTNDSALFPPLPKWEDKGYHPDGYGRWINSSGDIALPLYEGRMIGPFDASEKSWLNGKGRMAEWQAIPFERKVYRPQYLLSLDTYRKRERAFQGYKIGFMKIGSATNTRSMYAAFIEDMPCGESVSTLQPAIKDVKNILSLLACLNSFTYDYSLRCRLGGINLTYSVIAETPLLSPDILRQSPCAKLAARLNLIMPNFAPNWLELRDVYPDFAEHHWRKLWAVTEHERLRLRCILDAIVAELYGLSYDDFAWILRDDPTDPKGFWRVDKEKAKELRQTTLTLEAFKRLKEGGLEAFCQEDWQFSPAIGAQLGPRFTAWQEQGTVAESWVECEEHARRMKEIPIPLPEKDNSEASSDGKHGQGKTTQRAQLDLWST